MDPSGRVALVTGAAGGLGRAFCRALLAAGAKVVVTDINDKSGEELAAELRKEFGEGNVIFVKGDVTKTASLEEAYKAAKSKFGRLDIVVNNAGILQEEHWEKEIDINLKGNVNGVLLAHKYMGKLTGGNGGLVVNVASIVGLAPFPLVPIYCATKHAIAALARTYGDTVHVENTGVSVVSLCPGVVPTALMMTAMNTCRHAYLKAALDDILKIVSMNKPEFIGEALVKVILEARSGSVWRADDGVIEEVAYPNNM